MFYRKNTFFGDYDLQKNVVVIEYSVENKKYITERKRLCLDLDNLLKS